MTDPVERYGRTFQFDADVSEAQRETRIRNWMQKHAPDELKDTKPRAVGAAMAPTSIPDVSAQLESTPKTAAPPPPEKKGESGSAALRMLSSVLLGPMGPLASTIPGVRDAMGDKNTYRVLAQGALPFADEAVAGVRSVTGGPDYDTALAEERKGVDDFENRYGSVTRHGLEMAGALATLPVGVGAVKAATSIPKVGKLASVLAKHPWLAAAGTGAASGAVAGFGTGEGGFANRMDNVSGPAAFGAALGPLARAGVVAAERGGRWLNADNRVADYLRTKISAEKNIDPKSPTFDRDAMSTLRTEMAEQHRLQTDPRVADLLPETTEASLLKPGRGSQELARSLYSRQYDKTLAEDVARAQSQHGRVGDTFDQAFGRDTFQLSDADLLAQRRANAQQLFQPAYQRNIRTPEIDDALDRLNELNPNILATAQRWARAERRPIGTANPDGTYADYNTQYLHDIKRSMDEVLGEAGRMNPKFNQVPYNNAKSDLNRAMMTANSDYETAMLRYGEDSHLIDALRRGREEVFVPGSVDKTGAMDDAAIRDYLADPAIPQAAKDLFMVGAARALRENVLASQSKKVTHNWADILSNPEHEKRIGALINGRQLGGWDLFRSRMKKESENYKNASRATGNSRTAGREALKAEADGIGSDAMAALGLMINPKAPSGWRGVGATIARTIDPSAKMMDKTASILAKGGPRGTNAALDEIERMLNETSKRKDHFRELGLIAPGAAYAYPFREREK